MPYTGQDLLNMMELLDTELQLQPGEPDVTRGLLALNMAKHQFETLGAKYPAFGRSTTDVFTAINATANESISFLSPTFVKINRIQPVDGLLITSVPTGPDLQNLGYIGFTNQLQFANEGLGFIGASTTELGKPVSYRSDGIVIEWFPTPDVTYPMRVWGISSSTTGITAGATFTYPDRAALPVAVFATRLLQTGIGDETGALSALAHETFSPVIESMVRNITDRNPGFDYNQYHTE